MLRKSFTFEGTRYWVRADTPEEVAVKIAMRKRDLEEGKHRISKNMLVKDWTQEWLSTYIETTVEPSTFSGYQTRIKRYILPVIGNMQLKDVKPTHCQAIMNQLSGHSKDHAKKVRNTLFNLLDKARKNHLILSNPAEDLSLPRIENDGTHRSITDQEREAILAVAETHRAGLWVLTMLYCGLRPGETDRMLYAHINFEESTLYIDGTKTAAAKRTVPIPPDLLEKYKKLNKKPFEHVFVNLNGNKLNGSARTHMWNSFIREMNIYLGCRVYRNQVIPPYRVADDLVPYCLRHTYCTDLQDAGVPINIAREFMGHTSILVTSKIYTHNSKISFQNAADLLCKFHSGDKNFEESGTQKVTQYRCK